MQGAGLSIGGEFADQSCEAEYRAEHLPQLVLQMRLCFWCASLLNPFFFISDWRFHGQPHFYYAIPARVVLELTSIVCLVLSRETRSFQSMQRYCIVWTCLVVPSSAVLVSPHTDIALLVTFVLPPIFLLTLPVPFGLAVTFGLGCSAAALGAYMWPASLSRRTVGLIMGMVMSNLVFVLVLSQGNRLRRLQWAATQAERAANERLSRGRDTLQRTLRAIPVPLIISARENGKIIQANDAAAEFFGPELRNGTMKVEEHMAPHDWDRLALQLETEGQASGFETRLHLSDGTERDVLIAVTTLTGSEAGDLLTVFVDITERKEAEALMKRLANTDSLSGLPNRAKFFSVAAEEIERAARHARPLAVLMIDIDFFKRINDTHGHEAGDLALRAFGALCRGWVRRHDVVARLGGEEFGVLLPETDATSALTLANRLRTEVASLRVGKIPASITISIGVAEVLPGESTVDAALSRADRALYAAKNSGRNRAVLDDQVETAS